MSKKMLSLICLFVIAATSAVALGGLVREPAAPSAVKAAPATPQGSGASARPGAKSSLNTSSAPQLAPRQTPNSRREQLTDVPVQAIYGILFREVVVFNREARKLEARGKKAETIRGHHKNKYGLEDFKDRELARVAAQVNAAAAAVDREAKRVIEEMRSRYPNGLLRPGERPPMPPMRLMTLQQERDQIVLGAREQLRLSFGEEGFRKFDEAVQQEVGNKMRPVVAGPGHRLAAAEAGKSGR